VRKGIRTAENHKPRGKNPSPYLEWEPFISLLLQNGELNRADHYFLLYYKKQLKLSNTDSRFTHQWGKWFHYGQLLEKYHYLESARRAYEQAILEGENGITAGPYLRLIALDTIYSPLTTGRYLSEALNYPLTLKELNSLKAVYRKLDRYSGNNYPCVGSRISRNLHCA